MGNPPASASQARADATDEAREPDYRFTLANERTFLSWIRTALALLAGAVAIAEFAPEFPVAGGGRWLAGALTIVSLAATVGAALRWRTAQQAMRRNAPLPSTFMPWLLAVCVALIGLLVLTLPAIF